MSKVIVDLDGNKRWCKKRLLHREGRLVAVEYLHRVDGPAVEYLDGTKEWWHNGKRHREDRPAMEYANGNKLWYKKGLLHREDGPAVEWVNGNREWWINGEEYSKEDWFKKLPEDSKMKVLFSEHFLGNR